AMLGVLEAGCAYLPLEPSQPLARRRGMVEDARCPMILCAGDREAAAALSADLDFGSDLDLEVVSVEGLPSADPEALGGPDPHPDQLAYVLFTSGSSGRPKGVMVPHRGLSHYVNWAAEAYRAEQGEGSPVATAMGFDATLTALWPALIRGRRVILLPEGEEIPQLVALVTSGRSLGVVKVTPAHVRLMAELLPEGEAPGLPVHSLVIGGEALDRQTVERWLRFSPRTRVFNEYGPTETVVGCMVHEYLGDAEDRGAESVAIGKPIDGVRVLRGKPDLEFPGREPADAEAGEIWIGGPGVARGYLGSPDLTSERFVPDPEGARPGALLYRTGDLATRRPSGVLEFVGRVDEQLSVRGHRVEPGEVERALALHPAVSRAAVTLAPAPSPSASGAGDAVLTAFLVGASGDAESAPAESALQDLAAERLPAAMVPERWVWVEELPLTDRGKIDRQALATAARPEPLSTKAPKAESPKSADASGEALRPWTAVEREIAQICGAILGLDEVEPHQNFFDLGATSHQIVQMHGRLRRQFESERPVTELFKITTVHELAQHLRPKAEAASSGDRGPQAAAGAVEKAAAAPGGRRGLSPVERARERAKRQRLALARPAATGGASDAP
ncbi:MAG: non-ribosomal peptide synthetase, partial [Acidobacteriota bacterium]